MIEVSIKDKYMECLNCGSSKDVLFITIGEQHQRSFKLCSHCAGELEAQLDVMRVRKD